MGLLVIFMVLLAGLDALLQNALASVLPTLTILPMMAYLVVVLLTIRSHMPMRYLVAMAVLLGILFEVMYSHTQYIYVLAYVLPIFLTRGIGKLVNQPFIGSLIATIISVVVSQFIVFTYFYATAQPDLLTFLAYHLVPTAITNLVLILVLYPVMEIILKTYKLSGDNRML
ncbi:MAG: rod shape-determining protein MreD [Culicoidibacterales bacterium]